MKKSKKIKLAADFLALTIGIGTFSVFKNEVIEKDYIGNSKYISRVEEELDTNMQIMYHDDNLIHYLKPNEDGNIYVYINEKINNNVKENITKVIDEVNTVFDYINDNYNLVVCDKETYTNQTKKDNTTISFNNLTLKSPTNYASTTTKITYNENLDFLNKKIYICDAKIYLNEEIFENLLTVSQLYTIKHELMHCFGFSDIYTGYKDETSIMNTNLSSLFCHLSPNDLKMLYCCYGNKHINNDDTFNEEKMNEIKNFIETYTQTYYDYLVNQMEKNIDVSFQKIEKNEINNIIFNKENAQITIKDNTFEYVLEDYLKQGNIIFGENYAILSDINIKKNENDNDYNDFLIILKINDNIECYNIDISLKMSKSLNNSIDTALILNK